MPFVSVGAALALLLGAAPAHPVHAPVDPLDAPAFSADPKALLETARGTLPAGQEVEVLLDEQKISFDAQHRRTRVARYIFRVLTTEAAHGWATVKCSYHLSTEAKPQVRARVITALGQVHALDPSTLTEGAEGEDGDDTFTDVRTVVGPLPAMEAGAVVEEEFTTREQQPYFDHGVAERLYFVGSVPIRKSRIELEAPAALPLHLGSHHLPHPPKVLTRNGRQQVTLEEGPFAARGDEETYVPPEQDEEPTFEYATGTSWADIASEYARRVDAQLQDTDLAALAKQAHLTGAPRTEAAARALTWIHHQLRYTGVEFGDAAVTPRSPAEVLTRKYGDCKDLATLMVGLLRGAGISAEVALLHTGWVPLDPKSPGLGEFNHAIVHLPGSPELWIDATSPVHPPGELPLGDQGRSALIASTSTRTLVLTPRATASDNRIEIQRDVVLRESAEGSFGETRRAFGLIGAQYREDHRGMTPDKIRAGFEAAAKDWFGAPALDRFTASDPDELQGPFEVSLHADKASTVFTGDAQAWVKLSGAGLLRWVPDILRPPAKSDEKSNEKSDDGKEQTRAPRVHELLVTAPYTADLRYRILPPPGFSPEPMPTLESIDLGPAVFTGGFEVQPDGAVIARFHFQLAAGRLTAAQVETVRKGIGQLLEGTGSTATVRFEQRAAAARARGDLKTALHELRSLVQLHPKEALHEIQLSQTLLAAGFGEEARKHARRAVELEPQSADAHLSVAWTLVHDIIGRQYGPGFDQAGAAAEYRAAKKLAPTAYKPRADLAILLEHNATGEWNGQGAPFDEAIAEYRGLRTELHREDLDGNLLMALLFAGHTQEAEQLAPTVKQSDLRDQLWVAAIALRSGPEAMRKAGALAPDSSSRRKLIASAGVHLVSLRSYPQAAAMLSEALRGDPNSAERQQHVDTLGKVRRAETFDLSATEPLSAVRRYIRALTVGTQAEVIACLYPADTDLKAIADQAMRTTRAMVRAHSNEAAKEVLLDTMLSSLKTYVDGSESVGFRVRVEFAGQGGSPMYFVRSGRELKLVSDGPSVTPLALEALRRLHAHDLTGARQWFTWARDLFRNSESETGRDVELILSDALQAQDPHRLELASAVLSALDAKAKPLTTAVLQQLETLPEPLRSSMRRKAVAALVLANRDAEAVTIAHALADADPSSDSAVAAYVIALDRVERRPEAEQFLRARLAKDPDDDRARTWLALMQYNAGRYDDAVQTGQQVIDHGHATAMLLNQLAWISVIQERPTEQAFEWARRSSHLESDQDVGVLNTLAALEAVDGKPTEALQLLLKLAELRPDGQLGASDWFVFGRMAEDYGLEDAARTAYQRSLGTPGAKRRPASTEALAQARLEVVEKALAHVPVAPNSAHADADPSTR